MTQRPQTKEAAVGYIGLSSRYVRINKFVELTGYTDKAVRCKIAEGVWLEGRLWRRAPDGAILVDMVGYERWVEGREALA
jgi:predicted HNH restriction endonuclease